MFIINGKINKSQLKQTRSLSVSLKKSTINEKSRVLYTAYIIAFSFLPADDVDVDRVFVVNNPANAGKRSVDETLFLVERSFLDRFRQRARVGQDGHVVDLCRHE